MNAFQRCHYQWPWQGQSSKSTSNFYFEQTILRNSSYESPWWVLTKDAIISGIPWPLAKGVLFVWLTFITLESIVLHQSSWKSQIKLVHDQNRKHPDFVKIGWRSRSRSCKTSKRSNFNVNKPYRVIPHMKALNECFPTGALFRQNQVKVKVTKGQISMSTNHIE